MIFTKKRRKEIEENIIANLSTIDELLNSHLDISAFEAYEKAFINIRNAYNAKVTSGSERSAVNYMNSRCKIYKSINDIVSTVRRVLFLIYRLNPGGRDIQLNDLKDKVPPKVLEGVLLSEPSFFHGKYLSFFEAACGKKQVAKIYQLNLWAEKVEKILNRKRIEDF